mgnify:FL=1
MIPCARESEAEIASLGGVAFILLSEPPPVPCYERRTRTAGRCELPLGHSGEHAGRDTAGRWHIWERSA